MITARTQSNSLVKCAFRKHSLSRVQLKSVASMGSLFGLFGGGETKRGCELAPKEAPPGLKLATFAGEGPNCKVGR
jgi:hypothetical protein